MTVLVHEGIQLLEGYFEVANCELVILIPAKWTVIATLQEDSVEHGESEGDLLELCRLRVLLGEELGVSQRLSLVAAEHVGLQTDRRLISHLNATLQDSGWEDLRWVRGEPQPERAVSVVRATHG